MPPQRLPGITFDEFFEQGGTEGFARAAALRAIAEERATLAAGPRGMARPLSAMTMT
jgi:hypothetical protein